MRRDPLNSHRAIGLDDCRVAVGATLRWAGPMSMPELDGSCRSASAVTAGKEAHFSV